MKLYEITHALRHVAEMDIPYDQKVDTLDELKMSMDEKIDGCLAIRAEMINSANGFDTEIKRMQALKKTCENQADSMKNYVLFNMVNSGMKTHKGKFNASLAKGLQSVSVTDESLIPAQYKKITETVDKVSLKNELKNGAEINGAKLVTGETRILIK